MPDPKFYLARANVIHSVLDGIEKATKNYTSMSGWVLGNQYTDRVGSNEQVIKVGIANEISTRFKDRQRRLWVTLEASYRDLRADIKRRSPTPSILRGNPRHDILVWDGDDPWCVIEVKSFASAGISSARQNDIERIMAVLGSAPGTRLRFGLLAMGRLHRRSRNYDKSASELISQCRQLSNGNFRCKPHRRRITDGPIDYGEARVVSFVRV